ncbi:tripartite tricarboxylate transporter substrate binding protein [Siccirubricoccus sp. KC 17139]|uniref:Tripartite tricarboxylate transporter substrate binding protein n=1 Tax=Siccirubricoccus soli TaxID=2899147 RepID=A0ABT1DA85_9PROT|nr:tripartite tricarboxylate transporter substrate binding protein [Siccirubricoccus soli]MCO6418858.1 tripartite tricarboxylate transporter substrate binding protein [Siccirubricoccus soli]MCP2684993.1 tripartite tricarboxylate transporter substrate binding protein [Siccirubricoccus soli]
MRRRHLLAAAALAPAAARAQGWVPDRPVTVVNPFSPGGFTDGFGRGIALHLQRLLGQPFVFDYRPGAGATLGAQHVARAAPDGHTLLYSPTTAWVVSPHLYRNPGYDPATSFAPIAAISATPMVLTAKAGSPFRDVPGLLAAAKGRPGALSYASAGAGSLPHLMGTFFASLAGLALTHVPYRGGAPAMNDLLAGHVDLMFEAVPNVAQHVAAGRAIALMTSGAARTPLLPGVPTVAEAGFPDLDLTSWIGLAAPAGTPAPAITALNAAVETALAAEDTQAAMLRLGMAKLGGPPGAMAARIAREGEVYRRIIAGAGITAE